MVNIYIDFVEANILSWSDAPALERERERVGYTGKGRERYIKRDGERGIERVGEREGVLWKNSLAYR